MRAIQEAAAHTDDGAVLIQRAERGTCATIDLGRGIAMRLDTEVVDEAGKRLPLRQLLKEIGDDDAMIRAIARAG